MNSLNITGRITKKAELRQTQQGANICCFDLAVKRPHSSDKTDFFRCIAWNKTAELIVRYVNKGDMLGVTGFLYTRKYTGKDGVERISTEIKAEEVTFLSHSKNSSETQRVSQSNPHSEYDEFTDISETDDDLPF